MKSLGAAASAFLISMLFAFPHFAHAHSALVSAEPGGTAVEEVRELTLTFNEEIEPASKVELTDAAGDHINPSEIQAKGKRMTAMFDAPLANGEYTVNWRIISEDGHPVRGSYALKVEVPEPTPSPEPSAAETASPAASPSAAQPDKEDDSAGGTPAPSASSPAGATDDTERENADSATTETESESGGFDATLLVIGLAAVFLIVAVAGAVRKKKKVD